MWTLPQLQDLSTALISGMSQLNFHEKSARTERHLKWHVHSNLDTLKATACFNLPALGDASLQKVTVTLLEITASVREQNETTRKTTSLPNSVTLIRWLRAPPADAYVPTWIEPLISKSHLACNHMQTNWKFVITQWRILEPGMLRHGESRRSTRRFTDASSLGLKRRFNITFINFFCSMRCTASSPVASQAKSLTIAQNQETTTKQTP